MSMETPPGRRQIGHEHNPPVYGCCEDKLDMIVERNPPPLYEHAQHEFQKSAVFAFCRFPTVLFHVIVEYLPTLGFFGVV